jgi:hypothetical protein
MKNLTKAVIKVMKEVRGMEKNSKVGTGNHSYNGTKDQDVKDHVEKIEFPGDGYIRYYKRANNNTKMLDVRISKPDRKKPITERNKNSLCLPRLRFTTHSPMIVVKKLLCVDMVMELILRISRLVKLQRMQ